MTLTSEAAATRATMVEECLHCGTPAEVTEVVALGSTGGPLPHRRVRCVLGHQRVIPDLLQLVSTAPGDRG